MIEKMSRILNGWKKVMFSLGGEFQFLNHVSAIFQSISCPYIEPHDVLLEAMMRDFLWAGKGGSNTDHWMGRDIITHLV